MLKVSDIHLNRGGSLIRFKSKASECEHQWEPHLWESERAYCARCGSFALIAVDDGGRDE